MIAVKTPQLRVSKVRIVCYLQIVRSSCFLSKDRRFLATWHTGLHRVIGHTGRSDIGLKQIQVAGMLKSNLASAFKNRADKPDIGERPTQRPKRSGSPDQSDARLKDATVIKQRKETWKNGRIRPSYCQMLLGRGKHFFFQI